MIVTRPIYRTPSFIGLVLNFPANAEIAESLPVAPARIHSTHPVTRRIK